MVEIVEYNYLVKNNNIFNYLKLKKNDLLYDHNFIDNLIKVYKVRFFFAVSFNTSGLIDGVLLFYINKNFKNKLNAFTFYDCLVADNQSVVKNIISEVETYANKKKINSFIINTPLEFDYLKFEIKTNYIINISPNNEELNWTNKQGVFRTEVRKAIKKNFNMERKKIFSISDYYRLYKNHQIQKKIPIHDFEFFSKIFNSKSNHVFTCHRNDILAGYAVVCINENKAHMIFANISDEERSNGVSQFIYWDIIKLLSKISCEYLILGPSIKNKGTAFFKKKIGASEISFYQYKISKSKSVGINKEKKENILKKFIFFIYDCLPKFLKEFYLKKKRFYEKIF